MQNPGPQDYDGHLREPLYVVKGAVDTKFGSTVDRSSLLLRDVSKSPFKNPTCAENPSPHQYKPTSHEMSKDFSSSLKQ